MSVHRFESRPGLEWDLCVACGVILREDGRNRDAECPGVVKMRPVEPIILDPNDVRARIEARRKKAQRERAERARALRAAGTPEAREKRRTEYVLQSGPRNGKRVRGEA